MQIVCLGGVLRSISKEVVKVRQEGQKVNKEDIKEPVITVGHWAQAS